MFMKKFNQSVLIMEGEGISSFILPTDVHWRRTKVAVPCIPDVLADGVQKIVHREGVKSLGTKQDIVGEQCPFFSAAKSR